MHPIFLHQSFFGLVKTRVAATRFLWLWIVDFIVFVLLLVAVTKGPFKKLFQSRHDSIKVAVEEAAAAHRSAEANHKLYSEKLDGVETEAKVLARLTKQTSLAMKSLASLKERRPTVSDLKPMQHVSLSKSL